MSEWQPIETAPKDGTKVDLWDIDGYRVCDAFYGHHTWRDGKPVTEKSWGDGNMNWCGTRPTHWMKRPEPPK